MANPFRLNAVYVLERHCGCGERDLGNKFPSLCDKTYLVESAFTEVNNLKPKALDIGY